jgi:competence protein ComEA
LDPRPAPWRVFDLNDAASDDAAGDGSPVMSPPDDGSRGGLTLPVAWTAAAIVLVVAAVAVVGFLLLSAPRSTVALPDGGSFAPTESGSPGDAPGPVGTGGPVVEVSGAVVHPGVYRLAAGARVADAITAAGGYSPRVDAGRADRELDLARVVTDGEEIRIPSRDDPSPGPATGGSTGTGAGGAGGTTGGSIDLNTATEAQLDALPGIGPVTAAKIISSRQAHPFRTVADLQTRKLVGAATFVKLRELVVVH